MKKITWLLILIFMINFVPAIQIEINMEDSFNINESLYFDYTISSEIDEVLYYTPYIDCPNLPRPFIEQKIINLEANQPYSDTYYDLMIDESVIPQICIAYIETSEGRIEKIFRIITNPIFSFDIILDKKIFIKNEDIYIDYTSEISNPLITATLIYPNEKTQQLTLPTSIIADQIGTYELEITASKEDYKTIIIKEQFGVIKTEANIKSGFYGGDFFRENKYLTYLLIGLGILFISMIFLIVYLISRRKGKKIISQNNL